MIVDVIDLEFDTLNLHRKFDKVRHRRGRDLYNEGLVQVASVDKTDEESYEVHAVVEGNYSKYRVELSIKGNFVHQSSCTCQDYQNGYLCKHILATTMEVIEPHYASTLEGKERLAQKKKNEEERQREQYLLRLQEERKRQIYERKYSSGLRTINYYKTNNLGTVSNSLDLEALYEKTINDRNKKEGELATSIKLEPKFEFYNSNTLSLSFKIGQARMYILNSIDNLYQAHKDKRELYYGKQLRFIPQKENFERNSQALFDFIIEHAQIIEYSNRFNRYGSLSFSDKEIYVSGDKIEEIFSIVKKISINTSLDGIQEFELTDERLEIKCIFQKEKVKRYGTFYWEDAKLVEESDEYVLKLNISDYRVLYSNSYIYIFYKHKIYKMLKTDELLRLLAMFENDDKILIPEDRIEEFKQFVLPKMKYIQSDEIVQEGIIANKLASKILLDVDEQGNILLELKFCYQNFEFNILQKGYKTYVSENNIVRDIPAETEVIKRIFTDGFELTSSRKNFVLKNTDDIYEFLLSKIEGYMRDYEVLVTDKFKNKQIKQPKISNIGVRIDNGLLEINLSKMNIDISEIKDILKDYNIKKKYHKLKNGDFLNLVDNEDLNLLDEMSTTLDIDYSKIENGVINLPINRSIYLEKLLGANSQINSTKNDEFVSLINNIGSTEISNNIQIDEEFENVLRDYQKVGYKWLKNLEHYKFGGILADDMGLGKTLQIIALLGSELKSNNKSTSIVVAPSTLVLNWKAEIEKWCPKMNVLVIRGSAEERKQIINDYENYDLVITSYDLLKRDTEAYEGKKFKYVIADEAQYIKNSITQNATSLKGLNGEVRFALTGTPIENSVAELWSIFDFIMPGYLYNYNKFKKKFEEPILKFEDKEALTRLKKLISPFILRRIKKDVLTELPEKNITIMKNEMEESQEKIYLSYLAQTKKEIAQELGENSFEKSKFKILMLLTRLRQICCHPSLFIENYNGSSGKLKQCLNLINDAIEAGHKILLFSSYTSMFEIIEKELNKMKVNYFKLVGDTPVDKRVEMVDEFNSNEDVKIFLISLKAGGTGLNLTSADVVIHYDPWWNVSSENQATDRAYRIGQKNSVQVYKFITSNSIEEKINKMQERKEKLSKDLLSTEETFISKMSKEEILDLFEQ